MTLVRNLLIAGAAALPIALHAMSFTAGDYYTSNGTGISHFSTSGVLVDNFDLHSTDGETRGIAFGTGGNLFVVRNNVIDAFSISKAKVDAVNGRGEVVRSYSFDGWLAGWASTGNIQFDPSGQFFYVSAADGVYRFGIDSDHGTKFLDTPAADLKVLGNGDLLVAGGSSLVRYSRSGQKLAEVDRAIEDPLGLAKGMTAFGVELIDVQGVEYDPQTDTTFVTMLGYSGWETEMNFKVLALQGFSNQLKGISEFWYGGDMQLTADHRLLVSSAAQTPGIFELSSGTSLGMTQVGSLGDGSARFLTAMPMPIPEPASYGLMGVGLGILASVKRRRALRTA